MLVVRRKEKVSFFHVFCQRNNRGERWCHLDRGCVCFRTHLLSVLLSVRPVDVSWFQNAALKLKISHNQQTEENKQYYIKSIIFWWVSWNMFQNHGFSNQVRLTEKLHCCIEIIMFALDGFIKGVLWATIRMATWGWLSIWMNLLFYIAKQDLLSGFWVKN